MSKIIILLMIIVGCLKTNGQCPNDKGLVTEIGQIKQDVRNLTPDQLTRITSSGVKYLRARLNVQNANIGPWYLTVRDNKYRVIQTFSQSDFLRTTSRWTNRVEGDGLILDLNGCKVPACPKIINDEYLEMSDQAKNSYYSSQNPNDPTFRPLYSIQASVNKPLGDFVGFIMSNHRQSSWGCSGVMIASDLFLTNWHCGRPFNNFPDSEVWNSEIVKDTIIDLSWDDDRVSREYSAVELLIKDKDLDFAILKIEPINTIGEVRPAVLSQEVIKHDQPIVVIQHPSGMQKQISSSCKIISPQYKSWVDKILGIDFTHNCDTEGGSSGSPVFNSNGEVIGLHHFGFNYDDGCKPDKVNKAVRIDKIINFLRNKNPLVFNRLQIK